MAQGAGLDAVGTVFAPDRVTELLGEALDELVPGQVRRRRDDRVAGGLVLERVEQRVAVAERLVQRADLDERDVEEVGPDRVQQGVALLVDDHVDALRRVDGDAAEAVREELQAAPVVERVQVVPGVRHDRQRALVAPPAVEV